MSQTRAQLVGNVVTGAVFAGIVTATSASVGYGAVGINSSGIDVTGVVTATSFVGSLTGTATTATNLSDAANITTGTIDSARLSGSYNIDITGTATTATAAGTAYGLTGSPNVTVGTVNATSFTGSGSGLTGVSTNFVSAIGIQSAGVVIGAGITQLNFIGAGNTFAVDGTTVNISIAGGGGGGTSGVSISTNTTNQSQYLTYAVSTGSTTELGVTTGDLVFNPSTVQLGIGTDNPQNTLQVEGELLISAGAASSTHVIQKAYEDNSGTISWEGTSGQLFSITNNLISGSLFNVTNISGIPYLDVNADGSVQISPYGNGNVSVGATSAPTTLYLNGTAASNVVGLGTISTNTSLDFTTANNFSLTLTGSIVLENPTGMTTGQSGIVQIQQDGTGSRSVGFGSYWDFPGATAPSLSTGANALDCLIYFVRSSTSIVTNTLIGIGTL